jgi:hypothetical protein
MFSNSADISCAYEPLNTASNLIQLLYLRELKNLLVSALTDRYLFYYAKSNKLTVYSKKMLNLLEKQNIKVCFSSRLSIFLLYTVNLLDFA